MNNNEKVRRCDNIAGKWMPDGSIRFYQMNERKGGVPELVNGYAGGACPASLPDTNTTSSLIMTYE